MTNDEATGALLSRLLEDGWNLKFDPMRERFLVVGRNWKQSDKTFRATGETPRAALEAFVALVEEGRQ